MENNENSVVVYETPKTELKLWRNNYNVQIGEYQCTLVRDVDFGKVPKAKTPTLFKSGAEKILLGYGLYYDIEITDSYKDYQKGIFYYEVIARAYDDKGRVVRSGVGCCNTSESAFGSAGSFNSANNAFKKAKKRAVVDLALTLGSLSNCFTQDIEDENNDERANQLLKDDDPITGKQAKRIFAIASNYEITTDKAKSLLAQWGFASTKDIKQKDYDEICEKLEKYGKGE
ncbi:MAG: hypothetical protein ACI4PF_02390 [Christensenellales bacterium]